MKRIRFAPPYADAIAHYRELESAWHPEDDSGPGVAMVADDAVLRPGDEAITQAQYNAAKADIEAANAAIPPPPTPAWQVADETERSGIDDILDKVDVDITTAEFKAVTLRALRRLRRRGVLR